jgi:hypothetical protein
MALLKNEKLFFTDRGAGGNWGCMHNPSKRVSGDATDLHRPVETASHIGLSALINK